MNKTIIIKRPLCINFFAWNFQFMIHSNIQKVIFLFTPTLKPTRQWKNSGMVAAIPAILSASCLPFGIQVLIRYLWDVARFCWLYKKSPKRLKKANFWPKKSRFGRILKGARYLIHDYFYLYSVTNTLFELMLAQQTWSYWGGAVFERIGKNDNKIATDWKTTQQG